MKPFKFFDKPIAISHYNNPIFAGEVFFTMNMEEFELVTGETIPKYFIVLRRVDPIYRQGWTPAYDKYYYFNTLEEAETCKDHILRWEEELERTKKHYNITTV